MLAQNGNYLVVRKVLRPRLDNQLGQPPLPLLACPPCFCAGTRLLALLNDQFLGLKLRKPAGRARDLLVNVVGWFHGFSRFVSVGYFD